MFFPHFLFTNHVGQAGTGGGISPRLWSKLDSALASPDGSKRLVYAGDDFLGFGGLVTSKVGDYNAQGGHYQSYEETGGTITSLADEKGGVIALATDTTDNDEVMLQYGDDTCVLGAISDTAGADHLTIFEARFKMRAVANGNAFVGLTEEARGVANGLFTDADALADIDYIGFYVQHDDPDSLNFGYTKSGQTDTEQIADIAALTANTFIKAGFVYDPSAPASEKIKVYIDNVENATKITATEIATADFPDGEELTFSAGVLNGSAAATALEIDWWHFAQVINA